jgi:magnesium transporter
LTCDSINYFYVVDENQKLHGVLSVKELLRDDEHKLIKEIMTKDLVVSHVRVNRKRVAHLAIKHNIKAVPVLDEGGKFVGVLTSDRMLEILYEEHHNEMYRSAGIIPISGTFDSILNQSIWKAFLSRLPWILLGLLGGIFAAQVIQYFSGTLSQNLVLAVFIPLIVYIGNAVGAQTQVFFVRDIAFNPKLDMIHYSLKQIVIAAMIGLMSGILVWLLVTVFWQSNFLGMVIGLATFTAVSASTIIAISIPYVFSLFKKDPATGSGPFATILQDLLSIFVYFFIASLLL